MYVILPSNSPAESYPGNTSSVFTIPLLHVLHTPHSENWRVGAVDVQIPLTFYNLESENLIVKPYGREIVKIPLEGGVYTTPESLVEMVNGRAGDLLKLSWDRGFVVETTADVEIPDRLSSLLGLPKTLTSGRNESRMHSFDPWLGFENILVQCNLIRPVQVNAQHLPVLQSVVPANITFGESLWTSFYPIEFHNVQGEIHKAVSVRITDLNDNPIRFRTGSVVLKIRLVHE